MDTPSDNAPQSPTDRIELPGCGLGAYSLLLAFICILGMSGMVMSSYSLVVMSGKPASPLVPGNQVPVWRLQPLREAGILGLTDTPPAFHDESMMRDGTIVCVLMTEQLVKLTDGLVSRMPYTEVATVALDGSEKDGGHVRTTSRNGQEIACRFGVDEGITRFARQLQTEAGITVPPSP